MMDSNPDMVRHLQEGAHACLTNARQLVEAAELVRARNGPPRIAYHLAVLGLEEVGKSEILGMGAVAARVDREVPPYVTRGLDDHEKKLFWAIWGPSFESGQISRQQIEENEGLARQIHQTRLRGLYVDVSESGVEVPGGAIDAAHADSMIGVARARVEMTAPRDFENLPKERLDLILWLVRTSHDPTQRVYLFGPASLKKLRELGDLGKWVDWAKASLDEAEARARTFAEQEFKRIPSAEGTKPKWELTLRLRTLTHSIRPKSLNWWNDAIERVKLYAVNGKKDELLVKAVLPDGVTADKLFHTGKALADHILIALNIASVGYFYWSVPAHLETYAEKVVDLERDTELLMRRPQRMFPDVGHRKVLDDRRFSDAVVVLAFLAGMQEVEAQVFRHYLTALKLIARTDVHLDVSGHAFGELYLCLDKAVELFEPPTDAPRPMRLQKVLEEPVGGFDEAAQFVEFGERFRETGQGELGATLETVMKLKVLTDLFLVRSLRRIMTSRAEGRDE